jgi:3-oxoacyl-[acyl-carrier protein] reductase
VYFCSRTESEVKSAESSLSSSASQTSAIVSGTVVDVSQPDQVGEWIKKIIVVETAIDVIVSNVSSLSIPNTPESWVMAYQTDMMGTVSLVNACLPYLEKSKGNIVTISSVSGRDVDFTAPGPYGTFKAALIHYTAQLAHTLAPKGIRANTVSPGNIYIADGVWGGIEKYSPELFKSQIGQNPMGRMGKPEEIANTIAFLASEKASFISGANLVVDGALCTGVQF